MAPWKSNVLLCAAVSRQVASRAATANATQVERAMLIAALQDDWNASHYRASLVDHFIV
jgi:hypothetical protein